MKWHALYESYWTIFDLSFSGIVDPPLIGYNMTR
jgi:hypothetical protein